MDLNFGIISIVTQCA